MEKNMITTENLHVYGKYFINSMLKKIVANQVVKSEKSETKILETLFINDHSVHFCFQIFLSITQKYSNVKNLFS